MLNYQKDSEVAVIHIDDGKANAINHTFIEELTEALNAPATKHPQSLFLVDPDVSPAASTYR
jgi:enoyl-CoA hydratase/carnithine racemase